MFFNMWSFQIFKQSKSWVYVVVLCFQKPNIRNGPLLRLPVAKPTFCSISSVSFRACLLWNSLPQIVWIYSWIMNENERSRKYWSSMYFMSMNSAKNKSFIYVTPCELPKTMPKLCLSIKYPHQEIR